MPTSSVYIAFLLTLIAGLSTGLGAIVVLFLKKRNEWILNFSLGFSAGVMVVVSFGDLLPESTHMLEPYYGMAMAGVYTLISFIIGLICAALIDKLVPEFDGEQVGRVGMVSMIALMLHNLPEGIATFMAGYQDINLGISITIAIALHNIPEGISIAVPIYYATGKKSKAFGYAMLSGLSEPLGAILTAVVLWKFINEQTLGFLFGIIGGIMVYIALNELIPTANSIPSQTPVLIGVFLGIMIMSLAI